MARPDRSAEIDASLLRAVGEHPHDLVAMVAAQLGLSRQRVHQRAQMLVLEDYLSKQGTTRPTYTSGRNRRFARTYLRDGLAEDQVWYGEVLPLLSHLPRNVLDIAQHGLTEMVNNAVDHSDASQVRVMMDCIHDRLHLLVSDNGVGIFHKIARALNLPDDRLALLELSKGKLTTDPQRHSGEGIFFTSRMFELYRIESGALAFDHDANFELDLLDDLHEVHGTRVVMRIGVASSRTVEAVFSEYSSGPEDYAFARTVVPVRLAKVGDENLVSRSQAKRLLQRVENFRHVVLDFAEVSSIGQAFADEIFRVFVNVHPHVELIPVHVVPEVQQMIRRAEVLRDGQGGQLPLLR